MPASPTSECPLVRGAGKEKRMSSPFASKFTAVVSLPSDPSETITIQKLPGRAVERAQGAHLSDFIGGRSPRGWAGVFQQALAKGTATDADAVKVLRDPLAGYDRLVIVQAGVKAWSYADDGKPIAVTPATIADLDDAALEYLAVEIMRLTKPALFEDAAGEQKNG